MEPPQIVQEEFINKLKDFTKKPENIGFVSGFLLTIIVAFIFLSKIYNRRNPKKDAKAYVHAGKKRKKGILGHVVDYGLEYGLVFLLSLIKENVQKYLKQLNEDLEEYREELSGE